MKPSLVGPHSLFRGILLWVGHSHRIQDANSTPPSDTGKEPVIEWVCILFSSYKDPWEIDQSHFSDEQTEVQGQGEPCVSHPYKFLSPATAQKPGGQ